VQVRVAALLKEHDCAITMPLSHCHVLHCNVLHCTVVLQARVAALLKEHPSAGQAFCRLLVAPYLHYIEGGKGVPTVWWAHATIHVHYASSPAKKV
jgi:hypothetical protein